MQQLVRALTSAIIHSSLVFFKKRDDFCIPRNSLTGISISLGMTGRFEMKRTID